MGYRFDNGWRIQFDALNLLNSTSDLATYAYGSLLTSDAMYALCYPTPKIPAAVCANGVMDYIYHPLEPLAFRVTLAGPLDTIDALNIPAMAAQMTRSFPAAPLPAGEYDWTGLHVGAHIGDCLVDDQRQHRQHCNRRSIRSDLRQSTELVRRRSVRLRLHAAVPRGVWRGGRCFFRRHQTGHKHQCLRHQLEPDHCV